MANNAQEMETVLLELVSLAHVLSAQLTVELTACVATDRVAPLILNVLLTLATMEHASLALLQVLTSVIIYLVPKTQTVPQTLASMELALCVKPQLLVLLIFVTHKPVLKTPTA